MLKQRWLFCRVVFFLPNEMYLTTIRSCTFNSKIYILSKCIHHSLASLISPHIHFVSRQIIADIHIHNQELKYTSQNYKHLLQ